MVGAGAAGCAAAAAIAAAGRGPVLLLEAGPGGAHPPELRSPNYLRAPTAADRTWPDLCVRRTPGGPLVPYLQGRGVGGSTAVNGGLLEVPSDADAQRLGWPWLTRAANALVEPGGALASRQAQPDDWGPLDRALATAAPHVLPGAPVAGARLARRAGSRLDAALAFVGETSPRVSVRAGALVDRVVVDAGWAVGVELASGEQMQAGAVVLAAGALATPAILLGSGVTDGVGFGLVDHAAVALTLPLRPEARRTSIDAAPTGVSTRSDDIALVPLGLTGADEGSLATGAVLGIRLETQGRGTVAAGAVTFDLLGDERDRAGLRAVVRTLAALARRPEIAALTVAPPTLGGDGTPVEIADADDATLDAWLEEHLADVFHAAGSCHAAVDASGRVKDVANCWVVDASILPDLPRCAPGLTVMAAAHHLAASIASRP